MLQARPGAVGNGFSLMLLINPLYVFTGFCICNHILQNRRRNYNYKSNNIYRDHLEKYLLFLHHDWPSIPNYSVMMAIALVVRWSYPFFQSQYSFWSYFLFYSTCTTFRTHVFKLSTIFVKPILTHRALKPVLKLVKDIGSTIIRITVEINTFTYLPTLQLKYK